MSCLCNNHKKIIKNQKESVHKKSVCVMGMRVSFNCVCVVCVVIGDIVGGMCITVCVLLVMSVW